MFPYEIKQEILTKFVQGVPISKLMKAYHVIGMNALKCLVFKD